MKGTFKENEILAPHTSWHIGGPAQHYYQPYDVADLALFLKSLPLQEPLTWLGLGSNVLISDLGLPGTVIHTLGMKSNTPEIISPNPLIVRVEAGVPCAKVAKFCAKHHLPGSEFFAGIPGTLGGALAMNAGAFGGETWQYVVAVEVLNKKGEVIIRKPDEYEIAYRSVKRKINNATNLIDPNEWFVAGHFSFECPVDKPTTSESGISKQASIEQNIKTLLRKRSDTQPIGVFSCGSVFKNPPNHYAGKLIEASHLKGFKMGEAQVSPKHANFIINIGHAKAMDVYALIQHIQRTVLEQQGVQLETEVRFLGEFK